MSESAIVVTNLKKSFKLPHENHSGVKQLLINFMSKKKNSGYENQQVLKGVSFEVQKGDFFGIVGRNGSGKSTLLKLISGIYTPDEGGVAINGSLTPFIELGVGFNPELTGRENVFLNGALLGFSHSEMELIYDDIVEFAELERFMDQKLKNYSSGMQVRLAFSIAIRAQSDILILDEVLAVGDEAFQRKCNIFFNEIKKDKSKTVVLVTHDMESVKKYCNKAILVRNGEIAVSGSVDKVATEYSMENAVSKGTRKGSEQRIGLSDIIPEFNVTLNSKPQLKEGDTFECTVTYKITKDIPVRFGISIMDTKANYPVMNDWVRTDDGSREVTSETSGEYTFNYKWKISGINSKGFTFIATLYSLENEEPFPIAFIPMERGVNFFVKHSGSNSALLDQEGVWKRVV